MEDKNNNKKSPTASYDHNYNEKNNYLTYTDDNGLVYESGDCVYIDSQRSDLAYFICTIREIKKGKKGYVMDVLWFYRPCEIPTSVYQLLIQDRMVSGERVLDNQNVISRELFISDAVDTYSVKSLRGKCIIRSYFDIQPFIYSYVEEKDQWFYLFKYNPDSRRLATTHGEIRIGSSHQAAIPNFIAEIPDDNYLSLNVETIIWTPVLNSVQLNQYIQASRSILSLSSYCKNICKSDIFVDFINNDYSLEILLENLNKNDYNSTQALLYIAENAISITEDIINKRDSFTDIDKKNFFRGLKQYGKCFYTLKTEFFPYRKTSELVFFYYSKKKYINSSQIKYTTYSSRKCRKNSFYRKAKKIYSRSSSDDDCKNEAKNSENKITPIDLSSYSENSDTKNNDIADSDVYQNSDNLSCNNFEQSYYYCQNCLTKDSPNWHHAGRYGLLLCHNCRLHFFRYSYLPMIQQYDLSDSKTVEMASYYNEQKTEDLICNFSDNLIDNGSENNYNDFQSTNVINIYPIPEDHSINMENNQNFNQIGSAVNNDFKVCNSNRILPNISSSSQCDQLYMVDYSFNSADKKTEITVNSNTKMADSDVEDQSVSNNEVGSRNTITSELKQDEVNQSSDEDYKNESKDEITEDNNDDMEKIFPRRSSRISSFNFNSLQNKKEVNIPEQSLPDELLSKLPDYLKLDSSFENNTLLFSARTSIIYTPSQQELDKRKKRAFDLKTQIKNMGKSFSISKSSFSKDHSNEITKAYSCESKTYYETNNNQLFQQTCQGSNSSTNDTFTMDANSNNYSQYPKQSRFPKERSKQAKKFDPDAPLSNYRDSDRNISCIKEDVNSFYSTNKYQNASKSYYSSINSSSNIDNPKKNSYQPLYSKFDKMNEPFCNQKQLNESTFYDYQLSHATQAYIKTFSSHLERNNLHQMKSVRNGPLNYPYMTGHVLPYAGLPQSSGIYKVPSIHSTSNLIASNNPITNNFSNYSNFMNPHEHFQKYSNSFNSSPNFSTESFNSSPNFSMSNNTNTQHALQKPNQQSQLSNYRVNQTYNNKNLITNMQKNPPSLSTTTTSGSYDMTFRNSSLYKKFSICQPFNHPTLPVSSGVNHSFKNTTVSPSEQYFQPSIAPIAPMNIFNSGHRVGYYVGSQTIPNMNTFGSSSQNPSNSNKIPAFLSNHSHKSLHNLQNSDHATTSTINTSKNFYYSSR